MQDIFDPEGKALSPAEVRRLQAEHTAAITALQAAVRDTTRLTRLLTILGDPAPLEVLLDRVLATLSELFSSDVVVLLRPRVGLEFTPLAAIGIPEDRVLVPMRAHEGSALRTVFEKRAPVLSDDVQVDPAVEPTLRGIGVRTAVWLPVVGDKGVGAVLLLARCRPQPFVASETDLLTAMAYRIAVVLERSRSHELLQDARERLLQAEKLALAGKISGLVAHELNNPLACVLSNLTQLRDFVPSLTRAIEVARTAAACLERQPEERCRRQGQELRAALEPVRGVSREADEMFADSLEAVKRISRLMSGLGDLSSADHQAEPDRQDVGDILAECVSDLPAEPGGPPLVVEPSRGPPCVAWIPPMALKAALTGILRTLLAPGTRRARDGRPISLTAAWHEERPVVLIADPGLVLSEEERRALFDPRMEVVQTPSGRTVRISLLGTLSYQLLRGCGADVTTAVDEDRGLTLRISLPAPPERG